MGYVRDACQGVRRRDHVASRLYEAFHRFAPDNVVRRRCEREMPKLLVQLGELRALVYRSDRGRRGRPRTFIHFFDAPPQLTCGVDGRRLYIIGGRYRITRRGIEG